MTVLSSFSNPARIPESTLTDLFFEALDQHGEGVALQHMPAPDVLVDITYPEVAALVKAAAASLEALGVTRGDRAAILSENRPEWAVCDYACLCAGVVDVPIYPSLLAPQVAYVLNDSGVKLVFVSDAAQLTKASEAAAEGPSDVTFVVFDPPPELPDRALSWDDFLARGEEKAQSWSDQEFRAWASQASPTDLATILYTSGTTGDPKGVMLTHRNVASNVTASQMVLGIRASDNTVSFLPLSHILQRMVDYLFFWTGCRIAYPRSIDTLVVDLKTIRPTLAVSVPRIFEKIYNGVMGAQGLKKILLRWAVKVADRTVDQRLAGREPTGLLALQYRIADMLVFSKVKAAVGGRVRFFVSGGGPLAPSLNRFFYSMGLTILEGYGLTETSPVTNVNTLEDFRIGSVGKPVPSTEIRIAADGEILVRGPQVMSGYYNKPEATAQVIDADGWFSTGDIGEIEADGFLKITDRKKDLIVTAGGKNVAPQPIENLLKTFPMVEQAVVVGDRRRYCALLVVPAFDALESWARQQGIEWTTRVELLNDATVRAHMEAETLGRLNGLASFERPKKVALLAEELTIENGFLTPTMKVKRRVVHDRLDDVIDSLYAGEAVDETED